MPLGLTVAEVLAMLRPAFRLIIRYKGSNIAAGTGHAADEGADEGGTQKRAEHPL